MAKRDMIREMEQNILNTARFWLDILELLEGLERVGHRASRDYISKQEFFEGLDLMRKGVYRELHKSLADCFAMVGVGGEEALRFARERFKELFSEDPIKHSVMQFMNQWCVHPGVYLADEEQELRRQAKEKIKEFERDEA